jgi:alpha-L-arabinofuranosidase
MKAKTILLSTLLATSLGAQAQVELNVNAAQPGHSISPTLYGIFYEDINHAADGGLYAELVRNRSFEDSNKEPEFWSALGEGSHKALLSLVDKGLLNSAQSQALQVAFNGDVKSASGIANEGFWGMNAVQGRPYHLSFWAKGKLKTPLHALLTDKTGTKVYASATLGGKLSGKWQKFTAELRSNANDPEARLQIVTNGKGTATFDVVSLMPPTFRNHANGLRPDLASMLYDLHPKFLRFPGGCFVEGQQSPDNAFRWQRTVGPIEQRPGHWNVNWGYRTSDGIGFDEYLQLAEDLGAKPLYVVNVGLWHGGMTPVDSIQPWIDECLAALEYANGPVTSKYGALRAKNGHPQPYNIEYLEIGNENNQPNPREQSDHYYERFKKFKDAILAKYPNIHLIGNVAAWGTDDPKWESTESVELLDEHYYRTPAWFSDNFHKYDNYSRTGSKIYVGEYAVTQGFGNHGSLNAALGEAVYMMGMENNSDVVRMASYAPIFANVNDLRWRPDMIQFCGSKAFGTPSYYVQKVMADNVGTRVLNVEQTNPYKDLAQQTSVTPSVSSCGVGTWGTQASFRNEKLTVDGQPVALPATKDQPKGQWSTASGTQMQTSWEEGTMSLNDKAATSRHYSYEVEARKDKGNEGFLVVFNYQDPNNYCWLNLGGWGNAQNAVEQVVDGAKMQTAMARGHVNDGQWYKVRIDVDGDSVTAFLDSKKIFATKLKHSDFAGLFSTASLDEKTGDVIVKVVNTASDATTANINLKGRSAKQACVVRLASAKGSDENSLEDPTNVYPTRQTLSPEGDHLTVEIPAHSLNIIRMK